MSSDRWCKKNAKRMQFISPHTYNSADKVGRPVHNQKIHELYNLNKRIKD